MIKPRYPIYIISKGRWDSRQTQRTLEELNVPYRIVIEKSEYEKYAENVPKQKIIVLPDNFREDPLYAIADENTGFIGGSIPVRNFVWEHSKAEGHKRHWILDDNMRHIYRLNRNLKTRMTTGSSFGLLENFVDRYENVRLAGMNYAFFAPATVKKPPYYTNTRIYSCILIDNSLEHRWRGRYNEDTDLSLRVLKDGDCTILFNNFLVGKSATMTMKGGNTETVYNVDQTGDKSKRDGSNFDNRREFAESLIAQHPDVVKLAFKWGRWHHDVNYSVFLQKPIKKPDLNIPKGINEHGMVLKPISPEEHDSEGDENYGD
jgi:hypothetical protein